jgi:hypothetical protein
MIDLHGVAHPSSGGRTARCRGRARHSRPRLADPPIPAVPHDAPASRFSPRIGRQAGAQWIAASSTGAAWNWSPGVPGAMPCFFSVALGVGR